MTRFTAQNTDHQYNNSELHELNVAWDGITSHGAPDEDTDDIAIQSMLDNWAETLLAEYAAGKRGPDLTAWFYAAQPPYQTPPRRE